jgi:ABC-type nitrate/sulfonate/bicarbonate transport system substrate-binding protein
MCSPSGRFRFLLQFALAAILILLGGLPPTAHALDAVTLQLKWSHAFQFAGYYTAKEKGYYSEAGLSVAIQEAHPGDDPLENVLAGKAQYGVGNSSLLLARNSGHPVVVLAAIFQHSPVVLIARSREPAQGIHDMAGKRLMIEPLSDELLAYLKQEGIPLASIVRVQHSFKPQDLIDGKVDAISAYVTNEPYFLDRAGFAYHTYTPRSVGIDFYGDNLFTTEQELKNHPARVKAFREATLRGWQYAMAHPEEIADLSQVLAAACSRVLPV